MRSINNQNVRAVPANSISSNGSAINPAENELAVRVQSARERGENGNPNTEAALERRPEVVVHVGSEASAPIGAVAARTGVVPPFNIEGLDDRKAALFRAVESGDLDKVQVLIPAGVRRDGIGKIDVRDSNLVKIALRTGNLEMTKFLLSAYYHMDEQELLQVAVENGDIELTKLLLEAVASANSFPLFPCDNSFLMTAVYTDKIEITKLLIDAGADLNYFNKSGETALMMAAYTGNIEITKLLLEAGADLNFTRSGRTALGLAAHTRNGEIVQLLLADPRININTANAFGETPLIIAASYANSAIIKLLTNNGDEVDFIVPSELECRSRTQTEIIKNGDETIMILTHGSTEVLEPLISAGADLNLADYQGQTALMKTVSDRNTKGVKQLIKAGADLNIGDRRGQTALMQTVLDRNTKCVKKIIKAGAEVNIVDRRGQTALMIAASHGYCELVKQLIDAGAEVDIVDHKGQTALMMAVSRGYYELVKQLIDAGAEVNVVDHKGQTALMMAVSIGDVGIWAVEQLIKAGAEVNIIYGHGETALMRALSCGNIKVANQLINAGGGGVNLALAMAVSAKDVRLVQLLLADPRIDPNAIGRDSIVALREAVVNRVSLENSLREIAMAIAHEVDVNANFSNLDTPENIVENTQILLADPRIDPNAIGRDSIAALREAVVNRVSLENSFRETAMAIAHEVEVNANFSNLDTPENIVENTKKLFISQLYEQLPAMDPNVKILQLLLAHPRIDPNMIGSDDKDKAALIVSDYNKTVEVSPGDSKLVEKLINDGAEVNIAFKKSIPVDNLDILRLLLSYSSIDPNVIGNNRNTALTAAALAHKVEIVQLLLSHPRIDPNVIDNNANTALTAAVSTGNVGIVQSLLSHPSIDPNVINRNGNTTLTAAALTGNVGIVQSLLSHPRIDPNIIDRNGNTALTAAASAGNVGIVQSLLSHPKIDSNVLLSFSHSRRISRNIHHGKPQI